MMLHDKLLSIKSQTKGNLSAVGRELENFKDENRQERKKGFILKWVSLYTHVKISKFDYHNLFHIVRR